MDDYYNTEPGCMSCAENRQQQLIITLGTANCVSQVNRYQTRTINMAIDPLQLGTSPYIYRLYEEANLIGLYPATGTTPDTAPQFTYNFPNLGTFAYKAQAEDSCEGGHQINESICSVTVVETICSWLTVLGGPPAIMAFDIMSLVSAYVGATNIGFTVISDHIMGGVAYYLGKPTNNTSNGNALTGCNF